MRGTVRGFFKEVVWSYRFLSVRFSLEYLSGVSRKKLYKDIVESVLPVPIYRSKCNLRPERDVLKRVKRMTVPGGVKSFFFKLHTGTLEVKTWMEEKGWFVPWGVHCFLCRKPETIEHVFLDCWGAVFFWDILQRTLKKDLPVDAYGIRFLNVENEDGVPLDTIMLYGLHSIWRNRMAVRYSDPDARLIRHYFKESIGSFVQIQKLQPSKPEWLPTIEALLVMKEY